MNMNQTASTFPKKLHSFIDEEEGRSVYWSKHGCAFYITDNDLLSDVLPKYFKLTKLASFQRQLNLYGFRRLTKGEDQGAYFHPKFQKNRKDLLSEIHRLPGKGTLSTLEQVLNNNNNYNNNIEHNPTNKDTTDKPNTELSNKQSSKISNVSRLPVKSTVLQNTIRKQPKQTKQSIQTNKKQYLPNPTNNIVTTSYINSTIPTSALFLNSSQYNQQYNNYTMQNSNNFYQYIPNQSYLNPTSTINSNDTFNSSSIPNNSSSISSRSNAYYDNHYENNHPRSYRNSNSTYQQSNDFKSHDMYDINNNYFNLCNQDHLLLDSLIDCQTEPNLNYEANNYDHTQVNNNRMLKDNLLSAFINNDNEECLNN